MTKFFNWLVRNLLPHHFIGEGLANDDLAKAAVAFAEWDDVGNDVY